MSSRQPSHAFEAHLVWSGAAQGPTRDAATFSRDLDVSFDPLTLAVSAAPGFRGDASRANPEQLFVAAVSSCQALTYLFLAARKGVAVVAYEDVAEGILESVDGTLRMSRVTLRPRIVLEAGADVQQARDLVDKAHRGCFIANSVSTAVDIEPRIELRDWVEAVKGVL
jgi:organic hydroperoxide reductase OsmC/OhrA